MYKTKGFSLVELMITVAIIGILTMLALPFYKSYIARVYIAEGVVISADERLDIFEMMSDATNWISLPDDYISAAVPYSLDTAMPNPGLLKIESYIRVPNKDSAGGLEGAYVHIRLDTKVLFGAEFGKLYYNNTPLTLTYVLLKPSHVLSVTPFYDGYNRITYDNSVPFSGNKDEPRNWLCGIDYNHFDDAASRQYVGAVMAALPLACRNFLYHSLSP